MDTWHLLKKRTIQACYQLTVQKSAQGIMGNLHVCEASIRAGWQDVVYFKPHPARIHKRVQVMKSDLQSGLSPTENVWNIVKFKIWQKRPQTGIFHACSNCSPRFPNASRVFVKGRGDEAERWTLLTSNCMRIEFSNKMTFFSFNMFLWAIFNEILAFSV